MLDRELPAFSRRLFIQQGMALASMAATVPWFVERSAHGSMLPLGSPISSRPGVADDHVLVVVQLGGGNDGLNTVIPYFSDDYTRLRPAIAVGAPGRARNNLEALQLDQRAGLGLHPNLEGLKDLYDDGKLCVAQGVGYPNPNRSHFASMDIWHTADTDGSGNGWLGRYFDNTCNGTPDPEGAIAIGRTAPLALEGSVQKPVSFESEELFRWLGEDLHDKLGDPYDAINRAGAGEADDPDSQVAFLMRTALDAQLSSDRIREAVRQQPLVRYPGGALAGQLRMIGSMIRANMRTRVYYATLGGFDTHANQAGQHANLMRQLGDALRAFQSDLEAQGNQDRVVTMVFSEFGRRVAQNASGGTDHGTAAPMFLMGTKVRPGIVGNHPSLRDLDSGDLKFGMDFRSVYTTLLDDWLNAPADRILKGRFRKAAVLA